MKRSPRSNPARLCWWLASGGLIGMLLYVGITWTTGCIYHDTCIMVTTSGQDWCRHLGNAIQWPAGGSIEDAQPVLGPGGDTPKGCRCFNDAEHQILEDKVPECRLEQLLDEIEQAAREQCQSLVLPGFDHNCWTAVGAEASTPEIESHEGPGSCIGSCEYGGAPKGGSCPEPNPYECATGDGGFDNCEPDEGADTGTTGAGGDESEGVLPLDPGAAIYCEGQHCEIDRDFARQLYADPSRLLGSSTRLVYDPETRRHAFVGVYPGTVAHALGLHEGDILEQIGGSTIDGLDSALQAYVDNQDADVLQLRILRGKQWVDFTYTFVP